MPCEFRFIASMPRLDQPPATWRAEVRRIEDLGFAAVAVSDHFTRGWMMDPIVAMSAAAEATTDLRVLSLVLGNDYRHPAPLHKALATLDVFSGGRVEVGIGAGWMPSDYEAAGLPLDPAPVRVDRLHESVDVLKGLFAGEPLTYHGKHYHISDLDGLPKPVQRPHPPLLIGGGGKRVLELAGAEADIAGIAPSMRAGAGTGSAVLDMTGDRVAEKVAAVRAGAQAADRDPDALQFQISVVSLNVTDVPAATPWVSSLAADVTDPAVLDGSPAVLHGSVGYCVETLQRRREEFGLNYIHLGGDIRAAAPIVARLAGT
ncbi:MAG TPA: TIGR03621 family F420-dependent LLM class oxidoreductase [Rugosimonospora sp.]|nr:TIGR03621 family F420-dependent LLM class oxidoreductase [Rugosimonospora sp.]